MKSIKKQMHFYIDESGSIANDSNIFLIGCIKTDTPEILERRITDRLLDMSEDIYYSAKIEEILAQGFHAVENHFDVRTELYKILPILNFRAFFVITNKKTEFFQNLIRSYEVHEIYLLILRKIILGRISRNGNNKYIFCFEEIQFPKTNQEKVLKELFNPLLYFADIEFTIVSKKEKNLGVIDYMNYILFCLLNDRQKSNPRMEENFKLVSPKIALINFLNTDTYLNRRKGVDLNKIKNLLAG
jgi:hypothetical protein